MKTSDLEALHEIADLVSRADLAKLAGLQKRLDDLTADAAALAETPRAIQSSEGLDPAVKAGAGPLWSRWRQDRLRSLQAERAKLAAEIEVARRTASRSFGRTVAMSEILGRQDGATRKDP